MRTNKFSPDEPLRSGGGRGLSGAARGAIRAATAAAAAAGGAAGAAAIGGGGCGGGDEAFLLPQPI